MDCKWTPSSESLHAKTGPSGIMSRYPSKDRCPGYPPPESPEEWHIQDWLLILIALKEYLWNQPITDGQELRSTSSSHQSQGCTAPSPTGPSNISRLTTLISMPFVGSANLPLPENHSEKYWSTAKSTPPMIKITLIIDIQTLPPPQSNRNRSNRIPKPAR